MPCEEAKRLDAEGTTAPGDEILKVGGGFLDYVQILRPVPLAVEGGGY